MTNRTCSFETCERLHDSKGLCIAHYRQMRREQALKPLTAQALPVDQRFWAKVQKSDRCWEWVGTKGRSGYGHFGVGKKTLLAHRWSYAESHGPIPHGVDIDHRCNNRSCVRPAHLRPATRKQNCENLTGAYSNSKSGIRGVTWHKSSNRWRATVGHLGKVIYVGLFADIKEAEKAVIAKRNELFTHNDADRMATK